MLSGKMGAFNFLTSGLIYQSRLIEIFGKLPSLSEVPSISGSSVFSSASPVRRRATFDCALSTSVFSERPLYLLPPIPSFGIFTLFAIEFTFQLRSFTSKAFNRPVLSSQLGAPYIPNGPKSASRNSPPLLWASEHAGMPMTHSNYSLQLCRFMSKLDGCRTGT